MNAHKLFAEKQAILAAKGIDALASYQEWDGDTILSRQSELAQIALKVWSFQ